MLSNKTLSVLALLLVCSSSLQVSHLFQPSHLYYYYSNNQNQNQRQQHQGGGFSWFGFIMAVFVAMVIYCIYRWWRGRRIERAQNNQGNARIRPCMSHQNSNPTYSQPPVSINPTYSHPPNHNYPNHNEPMNDNVNPYVM